MNPGLIYPALEWTSTLEKGDLLLAVPRLRAKGRAEVYASKWAAEVGLRVPSIVQLSLIILQFNPSCLVKRPTAICTFPRFDYSSGVLPLVLKLGSPYGVSLPDKHKKIVVEFSSPNIAKEFHVGHLRSTIIGGFLSNLFERNGWETVRLNYLGDWGRQFGLLAVGWKKSGNEETFQMNPIKHLFEVYVKISADVKLEEEEYEATKKRGGDTATLEKTGILGEAKAYFKRMEDGDEEALSLWRNFRNISIEKYKMTYQRIGIHFTDYSGQSTVKQETMEMAEQILLDAGITERNEGAVIIDFKKHGAKALRVAIIRNRNGTSTYLLRDVGAAIQRDQTYGMDKMIYVVMSEQKTHMERVFKTLELMGGEYTTLSKKMQHVSFGKVEGMSTRRGTVKFLEDTFDDVGESMHEVMRKNEDKYRQIKDPVKTADVLGISAVMVQDMSGKRINDYPFNLDRMTAFEGDTGPFLQYAHARLCFIQRKVDLTTEQLLAADWSLLKEQHAIDLI